MEIGTPIESTSAQVPRQEDQQPGLGSAIRFFRNEAKMTQVTLGSKSGIHPTWLSHIESGRINPTWGNVRRIAAGLNIALGDLADAAQRNEGDAITLLTRPGPPTPAPPRRPQRPKRPSPPKAEDDLDGWIEHTIALRDRAE